MDEVLEVTLAVGAADAALEAEPGGAEADPEARDEDTLEAGVGPGITLVMTILEVTVDLVGPLLVLLPETVVLMIRGGGMDMGGTTGTTGTTGPGLLP
ncbi:hypothetical protein H4219_003422 [Mycoemilia scoparia]|uniref:Uncharacterized protein n=1 Tax=Mycoemilia scoparia TaxID=417184 RepID=A0A9W7ZV08_9FUNG|nr:hypothetical protein H4219_003422 [Mycoemilia scoparia]